MTDSPLARTPSAYSKRLYNDDELKTWIEQAELLGNNTRRRSRNRRTEEARETWLQLQRTWLGAVPPREEHNNNEEQEGASNHGSQTDGSESDSDDESGEGEEDADMDSDIEELTKGL